MSAPRPDHSPATSPAGQGGVRGLRSDARRNRDRVLRSAQQLFATDGLGVSLDDIARHAGVGPGTVHRHFPAKEALYLAVAIDQLWHLVAEAQQLTASDDPAALFTLLARMMANGAENVAVKSALAATELDLRTAAPEVAVELTGQVSGLLDRAQVAGAARADLTVGEVMAMVAGAFAAIRHSGTEADAERSTHLAQLIIDGLRPRPQ